jgi:hypothetical protein
MAPELANRIRAALNKPGRPGVRKIADQFGVNPSTVQRISAAMARRGQFKSGEKIEEARVAN